MTARIGRIVLAGLLVAGTGCASRGEHPAEAGPAVAVPTEPEETSRFPEALRPRPGRFESDPAPAGGTEGTEDVPSPPEVRLPENLPELTLEQRRFQLRAALENRTDPADRLELAALLAAGGRSDAPRAYEVLKGIPRESLTPQQRAMAEMLHLHLLEVLGQPDEAYAEIQALEQKLRPWSGLQIRRFCRTSAPDRAQYGIAYEDPSPVWERGGVWSGYVEVGRMVCARQGDGRYRTLLRFDLTLLDELDRTVYEWEGWESQVGLARRETVTESYLDDYYLVLNLPFPNSVNPGRYKIRIWVEDLQGRMTRAAEREISVELR